MAEPTPEEGKQSLGLSCPSPEWIEDARLRIAGRERQRLARLLHEELSQNLAGAQLMATVLEKHLLNTRDADLTQTRALNLALKNLGLALRKVVQEEPPAD